MQEVTTTLKIKPNYKIYPPKSLFEALEVKPGDFVDVVIRKRD